jgi:hypothetical protein
VLRCATDQSTSSTGSKPAFSIRRFAEHLPVGFGSAVRPRGDLRSGGVAVDTERPRVALCEALKHRVARDEALRFAPEAIGLEDSRSKRPGRGVEKPLDLRQCDLASPGGATRAHHQPAAQGDRAEENQSQGDGDPGAAKNSDRRRRRAAGEGAAGESCLQSAQAVAQLDGGGVAPIRRLLEAASDDLDQFLR